MAACQGTDDEVVELRDKDGTDIQVHLSALPSARVVDVDSGGIPSFVAGNLGAAKLADEITDAELRDLVAGIAPVFRASADDLVLRKARTDEQGDRHLRLQQYKNGLKVIGGELVIHIRDGMVMAANGSARDDLRAAVEPELDAADAVRVARDSTVSVADAAAQGEPELAYRLADDRLDLVYAVDVTGVEADGTPLHDTVLVNAIDGSISLRIPHIHTAKNRELHNLNHGTSLTGPIARVEGGAAVSDTDVNVNYDWLGATYDCYFQLFGRDSYNGAGIKMISSVHYSNNYVNAYWNGTQMVYGDGDGTTASSLARSMDVTAHELTHAVTNTESNLVYSGESGGLNEAMSDIFGGVCEWFRDGKVISNNTWIVGDDCWTPATPGDGLRYMNDPVKDNKSLDYYPNYTSGTDVHYSSGIANLAFFLLSQGGTHPRGRTTTVVPAIGIEKAARVFYKINTDILTSSSNFAAAKTASEQAATQLGFTAAEIDAVKKAWEAVGVGVPVPPPPTTALTNGVAVNSLSGSTGAKAYFSLAVPAGATNLSFTTSGGTGDVDLYVKFGSAPTTSSYDCRPYKSGNAESCPIASAQAGTYYVMLHAYSSYSGASLLGKYDDGGQPPPPPPPPDNELQNGVPVTNISGASGSQQFWTMPVPAGKPSLTFTISGGTGDADLYVRFGSAPTTTTYNCRPYRTGNNETCTFTNPSAGTWHVMLRGYTSYSGVSLVGQH